ncbi:type I-B CRISPR-associated protein Cas7/Cst2/DevR [Synechococcales cyanobacterium C]|uniref:Type I-B CRISPR-associated protein Cas7/Cst2/DevR n=1 Tax=Petrachloros mirabilis ULC683 TaxID=2781853 RepID=A0A8K1ZW45_9CYAN|nr:type I-B CRISPR-associated protein Cas7/Cst2/DevR [Petrachloros mirabilis]NCJ06224.1 type I-B CRISPR-associated protein Cas7/Cst2/DevR [Petrachloros mirabilis ULC683]
MTQHLFATIVTATAVAANNRGEGDGSTLSTLQKITRGNDQYTTISAEAIRWGLREYFQNNNEAATNRTFDPDTDKYSFKDESFSATDYIDDDLFGYMDAKKGSDNKDATTKRRGALEISRAISLDPYWGDIAFGSKGGEKGKTSIHQTEVHCTAYQYTVALTPESLKDPARAALALDAIAAVRHVGGNHSRFLYDFHPESIVIRITPDPSPWIMDSFKRMGDTVGCPKLLRLVEVGDVAADELIVAGEIADTPYGEKLKQLEVKVYRGVKDAIAAAKQQITIPQAA